MPIDPGSDSPAYRHPVALYLSRFAPGSHRSVKHALGVIAGLLESPGKDPIEVPWTKLTSSDGQKLRTRLVSRYATATAHRVLLVLRGVLREAALAGLMDPTVYRSIEGVRRRKKARGHPVRSADMVRLFETCREDITPAACRDAAALALIYGVGLRRSAAAALQREAYLSSGELVIPTRGHFARRVKLTATVRQALDAWLALRGGATGPLLCPVNKAGRIQIRPMTDQALYAIIVRRSLRAGVRLSPDQLRKPFEHRRRALARARRRRLIAHAVVTDAEVETIGLDVPFVGCGPACDHEDQAACGGAQ